MHLDRKMSCWIRDCPTKSGLTKKSLFTPYSDEIFNKWKDSGIAKKGINKFTKKSRVCELHFQKDDVIRVDTFKIEGSEDFLVPRKIPKLRKGAIPSIFPPVRHYHINSIGEQINYYRINVNKQNQIKQQTGETSVVAQLTSTFNCFVFICLSFFFFVFLSIMKGHSTMR